MRDEQEPGNACECRGQRGNHDERIEPGLKVDDDEQVYQYDRECQSTQKADVRSSHGLNLSADNDSRTARQLLAGGANDLVYVPRNAAEVAAGDRTEDVDDWRDVVVGDNRHSCSPLGRN